MGVVGNLLSDIRFCLRGFARRPMFAVVVVATLALGLSINAAIFSIYDQMLLRELPRAGAGRARESRVARAASRAARRATTAAPATRCSAIRCSATSSASTGRSSGIAAHRDRRTRTSRSTGRPLTGDGMLVSGSYFPLLGLTPAVGRLLDAERRSRRRRGERRRAELRLLAVGVRRRSGRRRPRRSSSTASR